MPGVSTNNNMSVNDAVERDFHHPYQPYGIQTEFMNTVYRCLEEGKIGILESPTGTGKSLSLICGSFTWLRDHKRKVFEGGFDIQPEVQDSEPDWILAHVQERSRLAALRTKQDLENRLASIREKEARARTRYESGEPPHKRLKTAAADDLGPPDDDAAFLPDDYESGDETPHSMRISNSSHFALPSATQALMEKLGMSSGQTKIKEDIEIPDETKIFYCSRTHSQIAQFVNELRRVKIPATISDLNSRTSTIATDQCEVTIEEFKHLTLGSRKNLCINPKVSKLGNVTAINERCLELQQGSVAPNAKCSYLPSKDNEALVLDFRDHAMAKIRDIEDFGRLGKKLGVCPYYASRAAIKPMEIVTLPYPLLLQKSAREALGISLKGHVVIIDEAHNLMDAIAQIHSLSITLEQLKLARAQLLGYLQKFKNRLKGKNRVYVTQLVRVIDSLCGYLQSNLSKASPGDGQAQIGNLLGGKGVDQVNLHKLMRYLQESKLARKVEKYAVWSEEQASQVQQAKNEKQQVTTASSTSLPVLTHLQGLLMVLTYPAAEGRFFISKQPDTTSTAGDVLLKYQLLDPSHHFKEIVDEARAVILAGGTMSPMSDYTSTLLHYLPQERIDIVSFGHVIPKTNLHAISVAQGPGGGEFDFTFEKRNSPIMIRELSHAIVEYAKAIPDGLVVFFPSYAYLDTIVKSWQKQPTSTTNLSNPTSTSSSAQPESTWTLLSQHKRIFLEPKSGTSGVLSSSSSNPATKSNEELTVDKVLAAYTSHINSGNGALLLAVIGGSLSEGINFSDRLGRGIIVVGLPFPNAQSAEWKAKMEFIEQRRHAHSDTTILNDHVNENRKGDGKESGKNAGAEAARDFYENACMRAVNQSVGRAIRHKDDYAAIVLLDRRYGRKRICGKLPRWIKESFRGGVGFGDAVEGIKEFFRSKS